jgi:hypothetical protein
MKKHILIALLLTLVLLFSLAGSPVTASGSSPNLVLNGDFEAGDFSNWTIFQTDNGLTNEGVEQFQTISTLPTSFAGKFQVGHEVFIPGGDNGWKGGGVSQTFIAPAGSWEASANIAAIYPIAYIPGTHIPFPPSHDRQKFELIVDGTVVDSVLVSEVDGLHPFMGILEATGSFAEIGSHEISISITNGQYMAPLEYIDNVELTMTSITTLVDIKPGDSLNRVNIRSNGVVTVAILGSTTFDASTVDPSTVKLGGAQARPKGKSGNYGSLEDVNSDGYPDMVAQVSTRDLGLTEGMTTLALTASTFYGIPVCGSDIVNIVTH